jgi:glycosyltransferase involved in cell wall biosynthesis
MELPARSNTFATDNMSEHILILAAQVQAFMRAGLQTLLQADDVRVLLICREPSADTPERPMAHDRLEVHYYTGEVPAELWLSISAFRPSKVYCAGWMERRYLQWCTQLKKQGAITICAMDTQWKGSLRQRLLCLMAPFTLHRYFSCAWVPGMRQRDYARRLGFADNRIYDHLCAADTQLFSNAYHRFLEQQNGSFPHRFLYVGRLEAHKLKNLLRAFHYMDEADRKDWRLQIIGNGSMEGDALLQHPQIERLPFLQQEQLCAIAAEGGVFCLCSSDEPWGTVIQEFASAGMPLVVAQQCGAQPHFLEDGINGFVCDGRDTHIRSLSLALLHIIRSSDEQLLAMGRRSHELGMVDNSATWAATLRQIS